jgi:hypothetical protein
MIDSAASDATVKDRQEALAVLGRLYERQGELNAAVDAYLAAVDAGLSMSDVAHHLARVYRVDIASIVLPKEAPAEKAAPSEPMCIEISTHIPPPAADLDFMAKPKDIQITERENSPYTF